MMDTFNGLRIHLLPEPMPARWAPRTSGEPSHRFIDRWEHLPAQRRLAEPGCALVDQQRGLLMVYAAEYQALMLAARRP